MNVGKYNKIIVVSLCDTYTKEFGNFLSQNLGMMFCSTKDLIEYELIDKKNILSFCTEEYLLLCENRVLKRIASFENVVVSINYDYLISNLEILREGSVIVFLNLSKNYIKTNGNVVDLISYQKRSETLQNISDLSVNIKKTDLDFVFDKVIEKLGSLLWI